jgi:hypothetical protein
MAGSERFTITELTGSGRTVIIRNRANPYRGVGWSGEQHSKLTWYPGNPVGTLQVLGPRELPTTLNGTWKSRYLPGNVTLRGFDDIPNGRTDTEGLITSEGLHLVFERLRVSGNYLEVRWGPNVRRGILKQYEGRFMRAEDVEWSATFEWNAREEGDLAEAPRAAVVRNPLTDIQGSAAALEMAASMEPQNLLQAARDPIESGVRSVRTALQRTNNAVRQIQSTATDLEARTAQLRSIVGQTVDAARSLRSGAIDLPYSEFSVFNDVPSIFNVELWRREVGASARQTQVASVDSVRRVETRVQPGIQRVVILNQNETLRDVARREYGNVDGWIVIADANGLTSAVQPPGTRLVIPRQPAGQAGGPL